MYSYCYSKPTQFASTQNNRQASKARPSELDECVYDVGFCSVYLCRTDVIWKFLLQLFFPFINYTHSMLLLFPWSVPTARGTAMCCMCIEIFIERHASCFCLVCCIFLNVCESSVIGRINLARKCGTQFTHISHSWERLVSLITYFWYLFTNIGNK